MRWPRGAVGGRGRRGAGPEGRTAKRAQAPLYPHPARATVEIYACPLRIARILRPVVFSGKRWNRFSPAPSRGPAAGQSAPT